MLLSAILDSSCLRRYNVASKFLEWFRDASDHRDSRFFNATAPVLKEYCN
ncbi:protein of unknown function [Xenorhabdus doucetiae]|uniref:Uncharacterized protein n=1 Tax=Xenorhabdus doucetiae TaxID=351671 RepID=A0A068QNK5_9GAMM|nr:protein of unknown function [Xenorhabdus doucetiae]